MNRFLLLDKGNPCSLILNCCFYMVVHHADLKLFIKIIYKDYLYILNLCICIKISVIKRISTYCLYILVTESHDIIKKIYLLKHLFEAMLSERKNQHVSHSFIIYVERRNKFRGG